MNNPERLRQIAVEELTRNGYSQTTFLNMEFFDGKPAQPFLLPQEPHFIIRFANNHSHDKKSVEDGDVLLCVKVDEAGRNAELLRVF